MYYTKAKYLLFINDMKIYLKVDNKEYCIRLQTELLIFTSQVNIQKKNILVSGLT